MAMEALASATTTSRCSPTSTSVLRRTSIRPMSRCEDPFSAHQRPSRRSGLTLVAQEALAASSSSGTSSSSSPSLLGVLPLKVVALRRLGDVRADVERATSVRTWDKVISGAKEVLRTRSTRSDEPSFETVLCAAVKSHLQRRSWSSSCAFEGCRFPGGGCCCCCCFERRTISLVKKEGSENETHVPVRPLLRNDPRAAPSSSSFLGPEEVPASTVLALAAREELAALVRRFLCDSLLDRRLIAVARGDRSAAVGRILEVVLCSKST